MTRLAIERREFLRGLTLLGVAGALPLRAFAKEPALAWGAVYDYLDTLTTSGKLPGVAAALARGTDEAEFLLGGHLGKGREETVGKNTLWRVYSMTKPITGMAAMMLIEDGKLKLDQPIADFIPGFASMKVLTSPDTSLDSVPARTRITVRHLLTHTAGLGYGIVSKGPILKEYERLGINPAAISRLQMPGMPPRNTAPSLAEFGDRLATLPLVAEPGTRWKYSVSLDLLGRVIEVASGKPFDTFLQERMFDPLGMRSTFWQVPESEAGRLVDNYFVLNGAPFPIDPAATSVFLDKPAFPFGGAGLVMSVADYDAFLRMLMGQGAIGDVRVMKPETVKLAISNLLPPGTDMSGGLVAGQGFGAGGVVALTTGPEGQGVGTFGWGGAAATRGWVDPLRGIRATGMAQYMPTDAYGFNEGFGKAVYASL